MNCLDCGGQGAAVAAVAVCRDCGAAVCADHATVESHHLTRTAAMGVQVPVEPPTRLIRCGVCHAARQSVTDEQHSHDGHPIHNPFHRHHDDPAGSPTDA